MRASKLRFSPAWLALAPLLATPAAGSDTADPATRALMQRVFGALQRTLPASLDEQRFSDPERQAQIRRDLGTLAKQAERLEDHGLGAEGGFAFLSRALARDAREIERRYRAGRFSEARYLLHGITETCATCHARLPDPEDAALSSRFMDDAQIAALDLPDRATLAMATRQFERALEAQEAILASTDFDLSSIDLLGYLEDYVEVCVRVKEDYERPARALDAFSKREGLRPSVRKEIIGWVADLRELGARESIEGLETARALVEEAEAAAPSIEARRQLVRYVAASGALHRLLQVLEPSSLRAAEAYYWLGVIESRIGHSFWLSQTESYLEAAIRVAPAQPQAEQAYLLLEEYLVLGYTGSGGEHVPPDVRQWLDELYRLIAATRSEDDS